jgi:hypothetical protein
MSLQTAVRAFCRSTDSRNFKKRLVCRRSESRSEVNSLLGVPPVVTKIGTRDFFASTLSYSAFFCLARHVSGLSASSLARLEYVLVELIYI